MFSIVRGETLGGSSTINTIAMQIGLPVDYNRWADLGNIGWNWSNVSEYFTKILDIVKFTTYKSTNHLRDVVGNAVDELGIKTNESGIYGYRDVPIQTYKGLRYSQAKAYLTPIRDRDNLCVVTNMLVTGLWFDPNGNVQGVFVNIGIVKEIKASKEVILSAGAIKTPQLLKLSGLGPTGHLQSRGIRPRVNLPVGQNLIDHVIIPVMLEEIQANVEFERTTNLNQRAEEYCQNKSKSGLDTIDISNYQGYINKGNNTTWSDPNQPPNVELLHYGFNPREPLLDIVLERFGFLNYYQNQLMQINDHSPLLFILVNSLHPKATETIELINRNPFAQPRINTNFLSHPNDIETILEGVQFVERLLETKSFGNFKVIDLGLPHCAQFEFKSPEYWECYSRTFAMSIFHTSGTCKMGNDSLTSVVNPRLQIWGMPKLRVVDSSVIPELITGHTNIPVGMIAEKAADNIKEDYT